MWETIPILSRYNPSVEPQSLGETLRALRTARGLGTGQTALRAGVSKGALQHWEAGRNLPTGVSLGRVLEALEADARLKARLLSEIDPRHAQVALADTALGPPVPLGTVLRAMRIRRALTQADLARAVGVGQSAVAKWESGDSAPSASSLHHVAFALRAAPEEALALASAQGNADPFREGTDPETALGVVAGLNCGNALFDALAAAYEAEAWRRATRDPRWDPILCRVLAKRATAAYHRGEPGLGAGPARRAIRLARTPDAKRTSMEALDIATSIAKRRGDDPARAAALAGAWGDAMPLGGEKAWALWIRALRLNALGHKKPALSLLRTAEAINEEADARLDPDSRAWSLIASRVEFHLAGGDAKAALAAIDHDPYSPVHVVFLTRVYHANGLAAPPDWMEAIRNHFESWPCPRLGRINTWCDYERRAKLERDQVRLSRRAMPLPSMR